MFLQISLIRYHEGWGHDCMARNHESLCDLHSGWHAVVLTAGFYGDFRTHNVRKVRVLKYIFVYGQIKAADQKYWQKEKGQWKICETSFWTRGFIENLDYFWARYCRTKVLDFSRVEETLLPLELTPNSSNVVRKNMLFQMTKKLTKERL